MKNLKSLLVIILAFFLVVTFCFPAWGAKTIKIGVIGPYAICSGKRSLERRSFGGRGNQRQRGCQSRRPGE